MTAELLAYLIAHGWTARPSRVDGISIVSKKIRGADRPAEFILPVKPGFDDEHRRIADALRTIAAVEGRSVARVADDIRQASEKNREELFLRRARDAFRSASDHKQRLAEAMKLAVIGEPQDLKDVKLFIKNSKDGRSRHILKALERFTADG